MTHSLQISPTSLANPYGAIELKSIIRKDTYKGFLITMSMLIIIAFGYSLLFSSNGHAYTIPVLTSGGTTVITDGFSDPAVSFNEPPPSIFSGPAERGGNPIPVPDLQITKDIAEFATFDKIDRVSSIGGTGEDDGKSFASNISQGTGKQIVVIENKEVYPESDIYVQVEKEPTTDMSELQKRIIYPEMAKRNGVEGTVVIRTLVGTDGRTIKMLVDYTDNLLLNSAALEAVKSTVFTPAIQNGHPISVWVNIPINFKLR